METFRRFAFVGKFEVTAVRKTPRVGVCDVCSSQTHKGVAYFRDNTVTLRFYAVTKEYVCKIRCWLLQISIRAKLRVAGIALALARTHYITYYRLYSNNIVVSTWQLARRIKTTSKFLESMQLGTLLS